MRHRYPRSLVIAILALALAACGGELATDGGVSGTWSGQAESASEQQFPLTLELTQSGVSVTGNFSMQLVASGEILPISVTGTATGGIISLSGQDEAGTGTLQLEGSFNGDTMQGTFVLSSPDGAPSFNFSVTR